MGAAASNGHGIIAFTYWLTMILIGGGIEWLYWTYAGAPLRAREAATIHSPKKAAGLAMQRLVLIGIGQILFGVATVGSAAYFDWPSGFERIVIASIILVVIVRASWLIAELLFAPGHTHWRLIDVDPKKATGCVISAVSTACLLALYSFVPDLIDETAFPNAAQTLRILLITFVTLVALASAKLIVKVRHLSAPDRRAPKFPAAFLTVATICGIYGVWLAGGPMLAALLSDVIIVVLTVRHLRSIVFFFWPLTATSDEVGDATLDNGAVQRLLPSIVLSLSRYCAVGTGIGIAIAATDIPVMQMANTTDPSMRLMLHLLGIAALAFATNIAWIAIRLPIDQRLSNLRLGEPNGAPDPNARLLTLLPLLRTTSAIVLLSLLALSALWTLGVEIMPLLAGAGIFGLAFGFGAQALVRDIITGVFYLVEDVFRVGEYIESDRNTKGTVERITFRTVALRHYDGPLHFVPHGSLGTMRNNSRDWVVDKFDLPLPTTVDSEQVRKLIKKVGEDIQADPEIGPKIREPLKGRLYRIDPGVNVFRCKFQTTPRNQWVIRAHAYRNIEAALKAVGIDFANSPSGASPATSSTSASRTTGLTSFKRRRMRL